MDLLLVEEFPPVNVLYDDIVASGDSNRVTLSIDHPMDQHGRLGAGGVIDSSLRPGGRNRTLKGEAGGVEE